MKAIVLQTFLVAVDDDIATGRNRYIGGQSPGFICLILGTYTIVREADVCTSRVI